MEKILVVDDDQSIRDTLSSYLKRQEYNVHSAENGAEALEISKKISRFDHYRCKNAGNEWSGIIKQSKRNRFTYSGYYDFCIR